MTEPFEYPKIETLFVRDEKTFKVTDALRDPAFDIPRTWLVTEKVDGTNIRVHYTPAHDVTTSVGGPDFGTHDWREVTRREPAAVTFHGRTDRADIPKFLLQYLQATFPVEKFADFDGPVTLFGEGYGARIQKGGGNYRPDSVSFRLFDVVVHGKNGFQWWLDWKNVQDIATKLGIETVPVLHLAADLMGIINPVEKGIPSIVALADSQTEFVSEGVVCRTDPYLFMRNGQRLVFKLKTKDF